MNRKQTIILIILLLFLAIIMSYKVLKTTVGSSKVCGLLACTDSIQINSTQLKPQIVIEINGKTINTCNGGGLNIYYNERFTLIKNLQWIIEDYESKEKQSFDIEIRNINCKTNETEIISPKKTYDIEFKKIYPNGEECGEGCKKGTITI